MDWKGSPDNWDVVVARPLSGFLYSGFPRYQDLVVKKILVCISGIEMPGPSYELLKVSPTC